MPAPTSSFPRVLVVSGEPFQSRTAAGLTMTRLFGDWPSGSLACLHTADLPPDGDPAIPHRLLPLAALSGIGRWVPASSALSHPNPVGRSVPRQTTQRGFIGKQVRMALDLLSYRLPGEISGWIDAFRPELIYSTLGSARIVRLVLALAHKRDLPVVPHFMDDWPSTLYRDSALAPWLRFVLNRGLRRLLSSAPVRLTIGDEMASAYENRYGGTFRPFMNCVALEPFSAPPLRPTLRMVYLGGLHLKRWRSLADIGAAVEAVARRGTPVELLIYTSPQSAAPHQHLLNRPPFVRMAGHLPSEGVPAVQRDADVLVHAEAFDRASRRYTRYSISTKIPEYMAAGRPILAYGPGETASLKYIAAARCGIAVGERSVASLQAAVAELVSSPSRRRELGLHGLHVAATRHRAETQRARFQSALQDAVCHAA